MTLNLTELRDELLDSTPVSALVSTLYCSCWAPVKDDQQVEAVAADDESVFKIDVDALSDEALDTSDRRTLLCMCNPGGACAVGQGE